jgi:hypothetical protein
MIAISLALCALLLVMGAAGFFIYRRFVTMLREDHPQTWEAVGRPGLVFYGSLAGQGLVHRFVRDRQYESLDDPAFVSLCRFYRIYVRGYGYTLAATCTSLILAGLGIGVA